MYALICINEENEVVSVVTSTDKSKLRKRMQERYEAEIEDALHSGYEVDDLDTISEIDNDWARVGVEDSWYYDFTITEVDEEI